MKASRISILTGLLLTAMTFAAQAQKKDIDFNQRHADLVNAFDPKS